MSFIYRYRKDFWKAQILTRFTDIPLDSSFFDIISTEKYRKHIFPKGKRYFNYSDFEIIRKGLQREFKEFNNIISNDIRDKEDDVFWDLMKRFYERMRLQKILDNQKVVWEINLGLKTRQIIKSVIEHCKQLGNENFDQVVLDIRNIGKKFNINPKNVNVFYDLKSNSFVPEIGHYYDFFIFFPYKSQIAIILNRNLMILHRNNKSHFNALIHHEFSHITNFDSTLLARRDIEKKGKNIKYAIVTSVFLVLLVFALWRAILYGNLDLIQLGKAIPLYVLPLVYAIYVGFNYYKKRTSFKISNYNEFLADLGGTIKSRNLDIIDVLKSGYIYSEKNGNHPELEARINNILDIVTYCYLNSFFMIGKNKSTNVDN